MGWCQQGDSLGFKSALEYGQLKSDYKFSITSSLEGVLS